MNYLAHLFLSEDLPEARLGNLMGDFVKTADASGYSAAIQRGIAHHHLIDSFTDSHAVFQTSRRRISPTQGHFAAVVIDIFYDHFLAVHWSDFASVPLVDFAHGIYATMTEMIPILPDPLNRMTPYLIRDNFLVTYRDLSGIDRSLTRLGSRIRRVNNLTNALADLKAHYVSLESDFMNFFPELLDHMKPFMAGQTIADNTQGM